MTEPPIIIQKGRRKAVIDGCRVALLKIRNKQRDTGVWPEAYIPDEVDRLYYAIRWVKDAFIDLPRTV